jgi:hypothetical protein
MILNVKDCDYEEHGISALNYDLIDSVKGEIKTGKHPCKGSYNKDVAASLINLLELLDNEKKSISQIILSSEEFEHVKKTIFFMIDRFSIFEVNEIGNVNRR